MADITITAANVVAGSGSVQETGVAGEAITAGKSVYKSPTTKKWMLADSNSATVAARTSGGVALTGSALNQPVVIHKHGELTIGATLTPGAGYYLSDTPGGLCPVADVGAGENVCQIGIAKSATVLAVDIVAPGVTL